MARPKKYDDVLRQSLISSAAVRLATEGVESLTVRTLADQHACSTTAIYSIFGSKPALIRAVVDEAVRSFTAAQAAVKLTGDTVVDLSGLCVAYRTWALRYPALYNIMFSGRVLHMAGQAAQDRAELSIQPLTEVVSAAVAKGVLSGAPTEIIVQSLWAAVHGIVSIELSQDPMDDRDARDRRFEAHMAASLTGWRTSGREPDTKFWCPPGFDDERRRLLNPSTADDAG